MTNEEIQEKINSLTGKKKKLDGSRTLAAFLFCIFLFDWDKFMAGDPSKLLIAIMVLITVIPVVLVIYETKIISGIKKEISNLNSQLAPEESESNEDSQSEEEPESDVAISEKAPSSENEEKQPEDKE